MSNEIDGLKTSSPKVPGFLLKKKTEKGNTVSKIKKSMIISSIKPSDRSKNEEKK